MPCNENPTRHDCEFNRPHYSQAEHGAPRATWAGVLAHMGVLYAGGIIAWAVMGFPGLE